MFLFLSFCPNHWINTRIMSTWPAVSDGGNGLFAIPLSQKLEILFESAFGRGFFKEGHDDGTLLPNRSNGESIFLYLDDELPGETGLPWEWEGYFPYDRK